MNYPIFSLLKNTLEVRIFQKCNSQMVNTFQVSLEDVIQRINSLAVTRKNCWRLTHLVCSQNPHVFPQSSHTLPSTISPFHMVAQFFTTYTSTLTWGRKKLSQILHKSRLFISSMHVQLCLTLRPHRPQPAKLLYPRDFPGKNTRVGPHFLLQFLSRNNPNIRGRVGCCLLCSFDI